MSDINVTVTNAGSSTVTASSSSTYTATVGNGGAVNVSLGTISPGNATVVSGTLTINSTTTLNAGQAAYAKNVGTAYAASLDLGIPAGPATLVGVGNTTTLASGSNATVTSNVSGSNLTLAFGIPRGVTPSFAIGNVVTGAAGSSASVTATATNSGANVTLDLTIPRGDPGTSGSNGANGTSITLSDGTPANLGTAAAGSSTLAARADHTHNLPVIAYGNLSGTPSNFPTNTTLVSGLSANYSAISHGHNYVTSLNNLTGNLTLAAGSNVTLTANGSTLTLSSTGGITANDSIDGGDYVGQLVYSGTITITQQPQNQSATNAAATFSVSATVSPVGNLAYQWQRSDNNGSTWLTLTGATASNVSLSGLTYESDNGDRYRVVVSSVGASSVTSSAATLTVADSWSGTGLSSSKWATTSNFLSASFTATRGGVLYVDYAYTVNVNTGYSTGFGILKNGTRVFGVGSTSSESGSVNSSAYTTFSTGDTITVRRESVSSGSIAIDTAGDRTINSMSLWIA